MAISIQKNARYWHGGRYRIDWEAFEGEVMVNRNRASFAGVPDKKAEDIMFGVILAGILADIAAGEADAVYEAQKAAYLAREKVGSDEEFVRKCVEKQIDTVAVVGRVA